MDLGSALTAHGQDSIPSRDPAVLGRGRRSEALAIPVSINRSTCRGDEPDLRSMTLEPVDCCRHQCATILHRPPKPIQVTLPVLRHLVLRWVGREIGIHSLEVCQVDEAR